MLASTSPRCRPFKSVAIRSQRVSVRPLVARADGSKPSLRTILDDTAAAGLGKVRFIVIGDGAILESVSDFSSVRYNETPARGLLATIASQDKSFECHITLSKVREVRFAKSKARAADYDVYAARFLGEAAKPLLVCLLHGQGGQYEPAAVAAWEGLASKYGESVAFEA